MVSRRDPMQMSDTWLREQERLSSRIEYHGPRISFPIRKVANDTPAPVLNLRLVRVPRKAVA